MLLLLALACDTPEVVVSIEPATPTTVDVLRVAVDGEVTSVEWFVEGERWGRAPVLPSSATTRGEVWRAVVTTPDGTGEALVRIGNAAPTVSVAAPAGPEPGDALFLVLHTDDIDGDDVSVEVAWAEGTRSFLERVPAGVTAKGEVWQADYVVRDGTDVVRGSVEVVVGNLAPTVQVQLTPAPRRHDVIEAVVDVDDPDGDDVDVVLHWWVGDQRVQVGDRAVLDVPTIRDDVVRVEVTADDGEDRTVASASTVVLNTPPPPPQVAVDRAWGVAAHHPLVCSATLTVDVDDDDLDTTFLWTDGAAMHTGAVLPPEAGDVGDWTCTATVSDGVDTAMSSASAELRLARNVLFLLADDLGIDKVAAYGEHPSPPPTPTLDALAADGLLFRNAYTNPVCSPTRFAVLTGRQPPRAGLGAAVVVAAGDFAVPLEERYAPEILDQGRWPYSSIALGKWHMAGQNTDEGAAHPLLQGFLHHYGAPGQVHQSWLGTPGVGFYKFDKAVDGELFVHEAYATTDVVDDANTLLDGLPEPWFAYVAFHAMHSPLHDPPDHLHGYDLDGADSVTRTDAIVEALDTEIGRLLDTLGPEVVEQTTVIFMGDNGTPKAWIRDGSELPGAKKSLYEPGINVPFIVSSPFLDVPGSETDALVQSLDVLPTLADIAAVPTTVLDGGPPMDGTSFLHLLADPSQPSDRPSVYLQYYKPLGGPPHTEYFRHVLVRDDGYKLIQRDGEPDEMYDLSGRDDDGPDLLLAPLSAELLDVYDALDVEISALRDDVVFEYEL